MRIAVLIGVSEYDGSPSLPAAARDVTAMKRLLGVTEEYGSVLPLSGRLEAEVTKRRIMAFFEKYEETVVDEVLFYYSGHGVAVPSGLAFALSDCAERRILRGSLENDELDRYLRAVNPKVAVKILDCCYSGVRYVKGVTDTPLAVEASAKLFKDCYFFSSSRDDQESWASSEANRLSVFTRHFLEAVGEQEDGAVRYKQIADSICDQFLQEQQEPQFIIQGNMRHEFCTINTKVRQAAVQHLAAESGPVAEEASSDGAAHDAIAVVQRREERMIPKEEAEAILIELRSDLEACPAEPELADFYEERIWFPEEIDLDDEVAGEDEIGKWLKHRGRDFFGWAEETDPSRLSAAGAAMNAVMGYRSGPEIIGFVTSSGLEYDRVFVRHVPKFASLPRWEMAAVILWSPWKAAIFSYGVPLKRLSWDRYDQPETVRWSHSQFYREELSDLPGHLVSELQEHRKRVASYLRRYAQVTT